MSNAVFATSVQTVADGVFVWSSHSAEHKVELTSCAVAHDGGIYVFDPIDLAGPALRRIEAEGRPRAIFLTNENHERAALEFKHRWQVPIITADGSRIDLPAVERFKPHRKKWDDWILIGLPGGAGGETAFYLRDRRLLVVGDALFNLPGHGFSILSDRYCEDPALLRRSLRQLVDVRADTLVMAHGEPLTEQPIIQVRALLGEAA